MAKWLLESTAKIMSGYLLTIVISMLIGFALGLTIGQEVEIRERPASPGLR